MNAIEVVGLSKAFGDLKAVQDLSFSVGEGEIFSLLGPNGAGKTTTIAMMCGLLRPDAGDAVILGHSILKEPGQVKARLGVVPQEIALYEDLTATENLVFWGKMYGMRGAALKARVREILDTIGLVNRASDRIEKYSGGMKRRVNIGVALLHKPAVVFMDEPTVGIDPQSRRSILDSVLELKSQGMTVLYTTHYMEEAQELSDRIAIMDHGELIAMGTHAELVTIVGEADRVILGLSTPPETPAWVKFQQSCQEIEGVRSVETTNGSLSLLADSGDLVLPRLFEVAAALNVRISSVEVKEPNLESVFLHLTGRALRD